MRKVSENLIEKVVEIVPITDSYRKAETVIKETTRATISHEWIREITVRVGDKINKREKEERKLLDKGQLIAGIMKPKEIKKLRDARVFQKYNVKSIKKRVTNGDGAKWTKGITAEGGFYQKDQFHIIQEIVRDVPKEYRNIITELINRKEYNKISKAINGIKYEIGGEEKGIKKLNKLQRYLSNGLERYQDEVEVPEAPKGIEYRNMGTQESQIFSKLKKRFCSGRKAFSEHGANALAKVCVLNERFKIEELETVIPMDTSVEDWIKEIERKVKENKKRHDARERIKTETKVKESHSEYKFMKEIMAMKKFSEM